MTGRVSSRCRRRGHVFREYEGSVLPVLFCRRWRCDAEAVPAWVPADVAAVLRRG